MPTYQRFEDLPVWQKAADLAARMFPWSQQHIGRGNGDLASQIQRATLSISNNIAEGFERGSTNELIHFLYIARGSAGEVRSMLCVMDRMPAFVDLKSEISDLKSNCENISRQIRGWTDSLQNSDIKGQRHLNKETKKRYEQDKRSSEFWQRQQQFQKDLEERLKREAAERHPESEKTGKTEPKTVTTEHETDKTEPETNKPESRTGKHETNKTEHETDKAEPDKPEPETNKPEHEKNVTGHDRNEP